MGIKKIESNIDVVTAAKMRIQNVFDSFPRIYFSMSGGKDSLCVSHLLYSMILQGSIDPKKLTVTFIDEEGVYPSMLKTVEEWRRNFLRVGAKFEWYCLPFKQVCTLDSLSAGESWITWEPGKEDVWMRKPPDFAIVKSDLLHYAGEMNYQTFLFKRCRDGISIVGLRTAESFTRLQSISQMNTKENRNGNFYPIYDWKDDDVWLYIKENGLDFPEIYMHLYEAGVSKRNLRLSAFFGDKTTQGLRWIAEVQPDLWEKIEKRMPNAYLAMLYWDSEMFARSSKKRRELEEQEEEKDYKELCADLLFKNTDKYNINHDTLSLLGTWRHLFIQTDGMANNSHYKKMYESILYGDPKGRDRRSLSMKIMTDYAKGMNK